MSSPAGEKMLGMKAEKSKVVIKYFFLKGLYYTEIFSSLRCFSCSCFSDISQHFCLKKLLEILNIYYKSIVRETRFSL